MTASMLVGGVAGMSSRRQRKKAGRKLASISRRAYNDDYLKARDRVDGHGWKKEDADFDPADASAYGQVVQIEMKKRPMGITRFTHGDGGKGAMVAEMHEKSRYPGDPRGQCAVGGVQKGWLVKSVGGQECLNWDFCDIMDLLEDFEPNYNTTQEAAAAWDARPRKNQAVTLPTTVEYVEFALSEKKEEAPVILEGKWYPRAGGFSDAELAKELERAKAQFPVPADYKGVQYTGPSCLDDAWIKNFMQQQKDGVLLPKAQAYALVIDCIKCLQKEKTMSEFTVPEGGRVTVCGDSHGQYWDVMKLFELNGLPGPTNPYMFNGDFVDRGSWSIENVMLIYALKVKDPDYMHLNRGNHELIEANLIYGFCGECTKKYDADLFNIFSESFRLLSLCHLINKEVLCTHGGLPGPAPRIWMPGQTHDPEDAIPVNTVCTTLEQIAKVDRYTELQASTYTSSVADTPESYEKNVDKDTCIIIDLIWSDPRGGVGYGPSYRKSKGVFMFGPDITEQFCKENNLKTVIRSHEVKSLGWFQDHEQLWTVFTAPDYMDTGGNQGGYLHLTCTNGTLVVTPNSFDKTPHPALPPMIYQEYMALANPHLTQKMKKKQGLKYDKDGNIIAEIDVDMSGDDDSVQRTAEEWVVDDEASADDNLTPEQIEAAFAAKLKQFA